MENTISTNEWHKKQAITCFNETWDLIDKSDRSPEESLDMIHKAHTSRYHWGIVGEATNRVRGEWLISRVYAIVNRPDSAIFHAQNCFNECIANDIADFDLSFAYEALSRSYRLKGESTLYKKYYRLALDSSESIGDDANKNYFLSELETIKPKE